MDEIKNLNSETLEKINLILNKARDSISSYCINECKAKCCRTGKLILLNENEVNFICGNKKEKFLKRKTLQITKNGNYTYNHSKVKCSHLTKDFKCNDWKNSNRPKVCYDFPLFLTKKKYLITANMCPAVQNNLFEKYFKKLKKLGIKII